MEHKHEDNPSFWNGVRHGGEPRSKHPSHTQASGRPGACHQHLDALASLFLSQWYRVVVAFFRKHTVLSGHAQPRVSIDCAPSDLCMFASIELGGELPHFLWKRLAIPGKGRRGSVELMTSKVLLGFAGPRFVESTKE